ncbi:MAG: YajQ family cyclic di-GMP-binding protein [Gammaproteobacteria bacterium]|nr:YajQ family cyclic di-GMP-binding protein [Gammaproteobacteria bacterium]
MPSFDVVSEVELHELSNAVDQANREVSTRFDFNGTSAQFEQKDLEVTLTGDADFQLKQLCDILESKLIKRKIDIKCLEYGDLQASGKGMNQVVVIRQGLDSILCKKVVKLIKDKKLKVQVAIQGEKVRVTGKKRDDLQKVMALLRDESLDMPLQFNNFRD